MSALLETPVAVVEASLRGHVEIEQLPGGIAPLRLPQWTREKQADRWIELWSAQTVGVRLCLRTGARRLSMRISATRVVLRGDTAPVFAATVTAEIAGRTVACVRLHHGPLAFVEADGSMREEKGDPCVVDFDLAGDGEERDIVLWLPHTAATVIHSLAADAPVYASPPARLPRWLHHGSSISHCLEAVEPRRTWPQMAAEALGFELTNYGIGGNAQLDYFVARTLAALPADVITLKLGVNVVNADSMRRRAYIPALNGFLDVVREGHPLIPIVVITPLCSPIIEDMPGPTRKVDGRFMASPRPIARGDGTLTLSVVRQLTREVVERRTASDPLLWCSDGRELLGSGDAHLLGDGLHPVQEGYDLIARRFVERASDPATSIGAAFAAAPDRLDRPEFDS